MIVRSLALTQQQEYGRSRSRPHSRPAIPRTVLSVFSRLATSHHQIAEFVTFLGPVFNPGAVRAQVVCPFHLDGAVLDQGSRSHRLEIGTRLGIIQEFGHPCSTSRMEMIVCCSSWACTKISIRRSRVSWFLLTDASFVRFIFPFAPCFLVPTPRAF